MSADPNPEELAQVALSEALHALAQRLLSMSRHPSQQIPTSGNPTLADQPDLRGGMA